MIILVKLFLPDRDPNKNIITHLQRVVSQSLMTAKPEEFGENDYCQVNIITEPLFVLKDGISIENKNNLIQAKKNGRNLFRNTNESLRRESENFEQELLKKISINIGNNLKILY